MSETLIERLTKTAEGMRLYQQERAIQELTELACEIMAEQDVSRSELARREFEHMPHVFGLRQSRQMDDTLLVNFKPSPHVKRELSKLGLEVFSVDELTLAELPRLTVAGAMDFIGLPHNLRVKKSFRLLARAVLLLIYERNGLVVNNQKSICVA